MPLSRKRLPLSVSPVLPLARCCLPGAQLRPQAQLDDRRAPDTDRGWSIRGCPGASVCVRSELLHGTTYMVLAEYP